MVATTILWSLSFPSWVMIMTLSSTITSRFRRVKERFVFSPRISGGSTISVPVLLPLNDGEWILPARSWLKDMVTIEVSFTAEHNQEISKMVKIYEYFVVANFRNAEWNIEKPHPWKVADSSTGFQPGNCGRLCIPSWTAAVRTIACTFDPQIHVRWWPLNADTPGVWPMWEDLVRTQRL